MRTKNGCVRNLSGPHADQNMFCEEMFTYLTGLHAHHCVNGFVYTREPSSYYSTVFICCIASVVLIRPKIPRRLILNCGNRAERQNKQEIIYLNEYLSDSPEVKDVF